MIYGSIESDQDVVAEYLNEINGGDTEGVNMVEVASHIYNKGMPATFEIVSLQLPVGAQFRFGKDFPWSNIPSTGIINFPSTFGAKGLVEYLEITNAAKFNIYFAMN